MIYNRKKLAKIQKIRAGNKLKAIMKPMSTKPQTYVENSLFQENPLRSRPAERERLLNFQEVWPNLILWVGQD
jgi:hypothetical protein